MTRFLDGPAAGVTLMLHRAPFFLRAVYDAGVKGGKWDALDGPADRPEPGEVVVVYYLFRGPFFMHIKHSKRDGGSGTFNGGEYKQLDTNLLMPDIVRDQARWVTWCNVEGPRLLAQLGDPRTRT